MESLKKIPSNVYLLASLILITTAIAILFLGKFIFSVITLIMGIVSLVAWTFFGLFEETPNN